MTTITGYNLLYLLGTVEVSSEPLQWYSQGSWNQHEYETAVHAGQHFVSVTSQIKTKFTLINYSSKKQINKKQINKKKKQINKKKNTMQYFKFCLYAFLICINLVSRIYNKKKISEYLDFLKITRVDYFVQKKTNKKTPLL